LVSSLADFLSRVQDAVHRADRAEVLALIQKCRINLGRSLVGKRLAIEYIENLLSLLLVQRSWRLGPRDGRHGQTRPTLPIERRPRHTQAAAGCGRADARRKFFDGFHGSLPL
jgi:hypothetical protein